MTWTVEPPRHAGDYVIYAVTRNSAHFRAFGGRLFGYGSKAPVLIVFLKDGATSGIDMAGRPVTEVDINRDFPGVLGMIEPSK